jgi:hypothetical protein
MPPLQNPSAMASVEGERHVRGSAGMGPIDLIHSGRSLAEGHKGPPGREVFAEGLADAAVHHQADFAKQCEEGRGQRSGERSADPAPGSLGGWNGTTWTKEVDRCVNCERCSGGKSAGTYRRSRRASKSILLRGRRDKRI